MRSSYRLFLAVLVTASVWSCGGAGGGDPIGGGGGDGIGPLGCRLDEYSPNYLQTEDPSTDIPNDVHWWDSFPIRVYFANDAAMPAGRVRQPLTRHLRRERSCGSCP